MNEAEIDQALAAAEQTLQAAQNGGVPQQAAPQMDIRVIQQLVDATVRQALAGVHVVQGPPGADGVTPSHEDVHKVVKKVVAATPLPKGDKGDPGERGARGPRGEIVRTLERITDPRRMGESDGASLVGFLQSGTGALTSTVADALKLYVHSSQYDTTGHYQTARAALTGTFGLSPAVEIAGGALGSGTTSLRFCTTDPDHADFMFVVDDTGVNVGTRDTILHWGYNAKAGLSRDDSSEPCLCYTIESDYNTGATRVMEAHLQGIFADGTSFRPWSWQINRTTKATSHAVGVDSIVFQDRTLVSNALALTGITTTAALFTIGAGTTITFGAGATFNNSILFTTDGSVNIGSASARASSGYFSGSVYTQAVDSGAAGDLLLTTNGGTTQFRIAHRASALNYWGAVGATNGNQPVLTAQGQTNVTGAFGTNGTGGYVFYTNEAFVKQFEITHTASSSRNIQVTGSNGGNPSITTSAGDLSVGAKMTYTKALYPSASLATNMTVGFLNIPGAAGAPSGTPDTTIGFPTYWDSTNLQHYVYTGGAWKKSAAYT